MEREIEDKFDELLTHNAKRIGEILSLEERIETLETAVVLMSRILQKSGLVEEYDKRRNDSN